MGRMTTDYTQELTAAAGELGRCVTRLELTASTIPTTFSAEIAELAAKAATRLAQLLRDAPEDARWSLDSSLTQTQLDNIGIALSSPIPDHLPDDLEE